MSNSRLPSFIIIGAAKSGTTTLHNYLSTHPEVFVGKRNDIGFPSPKEPQFFAIDSLFYKGINFYSKLFSLAEDFQLCCEASTCYTMYPYFPDVAERIYRIIPNIKLVYIMRNPVDRAYSSYVQKIKNYQNETRDYKISRTFEECLFPNTYPHRSPREKFFAKFDDHLKDEPGIFLYPGNYYTQISHYKKYFRDNQMLLLLFDDLINKPEELLFKISEFLEININHIFLENGEIKQNVSENHFKNIRRQILIEKIKGYILIRNLGKILPQRFKTSIINSLTKIEKYNKVNYQKPRIILPDTRKFLIDYYYDEIKSLEYLLKRDLSEWYLK